MDNFGKRSYIDFELFCELNIIFSFVNILKINIYNYKNFYYKFDFEEK